MSPYELKETLQGWLNLWGRAFAQIDRDPRTGAPTALWPLDADRMTVDITPAGQLRYQYRMASGGPREWVVTDPARPPMLHLRQNCRDGLHGRSVIQVLAESMGVAIAEQRYRAAWYGQGGHVQTALSTPHGLTKEAARNVRLDYEAMTAGEENWHRTVVLDHDLKPIPLAMPHRDAQFIENRRLSRSEITGAFRVPAHKINDLERATFSNIEHQAIEWVTDGLMPHFICWQEAISRDLLGLAARRTHFPVFVVDALVRGDFAALNAGLAVQRQNGVITGNQWRQIVDMDDRIAAEDGGNDYLVNGNMVPLRRDPAAVLSVEGPVN